MSGHIIFKHQYYGFDDAIYAAIRLIRAATALEKSVTELRSAMPAMVNPPEMRFQVDESRKFAVIDEVLARLKASGAQVNDTDGARVNTPDEIGRAHRWTPVTNAHLVCRLLLETQKT